MGWKNPITWVVGQIVTASDLNEQVRDNLKETAPAKAEGKGDVFAATGLNAIVRIPLGNDRRMLLADDSEPAGVRWGRNPELQAYIEDEDDKGAVSGSVSLDFSDRNVWRIAPDGDVDIAFVGLPGSGKVAPATLIVANDLHALTWPVGTRFMEGDAPVLDGETWLSIVARGSTVTVGRSFFAVGEG